VFYSCLGSFSEWLSVHLVNSLDSQKVLSLNGSGQKSSGLAFGVGRILEGLDQFIDVMTI